MKQTAQWVFAALVLAVMVFGLTFAAKYLGEATPGPSAPTDRKEERELVFPLGHALPPPGPNNTQPNLEREEGQPGHEDFWFTSPYDAPLTVGLNKTNCTCAAVRAFLLPADRLAKAREVLESNRPREEKEKQLAALKEGVSSAAELKEKAESIEVPARGVGWMRLEWSGRKPGRGVLQARVWMSSPDKGKVATLEVYLTLYEPLRVRLVPIQPLVLDDSDLQEGKKWTIYCWSSTRSKFALKASLGKPMGAVAAPLEVGEPVALSEKDRQWLQKDNKANNSPNSDALSGDVLHGYRVEVTARNRVDKGKETPFPIGPFRRTVELSSPDIKDAVKQVAVTGLVRGLVEISNDDDGGVNFNAFRRSAGKRMTVRLSSEAEGLRLTESADQPAKFLTPRVRPARVFRFVTLGDLSAKFKDGDTVDEAALVKAGLLKKPSGADREVYVLGDGELTKKLTVKAHQFSDDAEKKIAEKGGTVTKLKTGRDEGSNQQWTLEIEIAPNKASGPFPRREDPQYQDSAVYLTAQQPGKSPRSIRIPVRGVATEN